MANTNTQGRAFSQIKKDLSEGILSLKEPGDLLLHIVYCIPALAPLRVCLEVGIFPYLSQAAASGKGDVSAEELADTLPWNPHLDLNRAVAAPLRRDFIVRMLRQVCALGLVDEGAKPFTYLANDVTKHMAEPSITAGFLLVFDAAMGPKSTMTSMLSYAQENSFCSPSSAEDGPYQHARDIVVTSTFDHWVQKEPHQLSRLSEYLSMVQKVRLHWTTWFPAEILFPPSKSTSPNRIFMVDVGGGLGHDLFAFAARYQDPSLRFVLQDQPSVIEQCKTELTTEKRELDSRVTLSAHDFFAEQPVRGANIYYLHKVLHDWPDGECARILARLRDALAPDSSIFINEMIVPDKGASILAAGVDITMLAFHSGKERDEQSWRNLVNSVGGLKIDAFYPPPGNDGEGIVTVVSL